MILLEHDSSRRRTPSARRTTRVIAVKQPPRPRAKRGQSCGDDDAVGVMGSAVRIQVLLTPRRTRSRTRRVRQESDYPDTGRSRPKLPKGAIPCWKRQNTFIYCRRESAVADICRGRNFGDRTVLPGTQANRHGSFRVAPRVLASAHYRAGSDICGIYEHLFVHNRRPLAAARP